MKHYVPAAGSKSERLIAALASIGLDTQLNTLELGNSVGVQPDQVHGLLSAAQRHRLVQRCGAERNGAVLWSLTPAGRARFAASSVAGAVEEISAPEADAHLEAVQRVVPAGEAAPLARGRSAWWGGIEA